MATQTASPNSNSDENLDKHNDFEGYYKDFKNDDDEAEAKNEGITEENTNMNKKSGEEESVIITDRKTSFHEEYYDSMPQPLHKSDSRFYYYYY